MVWRALRRADGRQVVLKQSGPAFSASEGAARLQREHRIGRRFGRDDIVRHLGMVELPSGPALVLEAIDGEPLREVLAREGLAGLRRFLEVAIRLTEALMAVHAEGVVHRDVNPNNVLVRTDGRLVLADFGIASPVPSVRPGDRVGAAAEATLAYAAPEQLGRLNRAVDGRADLYALGATLYEVVSGKPPFPGEDPLEVVHAHVAVAPRPLSAVRSDLPPIVSDVVLRLLAKDPDARYQSAAGLHHDLLALRALHEAGREVTLDLGTRDVPAELVLPQRLVGRDDVLAMLDTALGQAAGRPPRLLVVRGPAGVGKSALVGEVRRRAVTARGQVGSGAFRALQRDVPYLGIAEAFRELGAMLLSRPPEEVAAWRRILLEAAGPGAGLVARVVPEAAAMLGEHEVGDMDPATARRRLHRAFVAVLRALAERAAPLVLVLDDVQWADAASVELLQALLGEDGVAGLVVLATVRDEALGVQAPAFPLVRAAEGQGDALALAPLDVSAVAELVGGALSQSAEAVAPLATLVHARTGGNPFFVRLFLSALAEEGALAFDPAAYAWSWDLDAIAARGVTDNLATLAVARVQRLPDGVRRVLEAAACLGGQVHASDVARVAAVPEEQATEALQDAARQQVMFSSGEGFYRFAHGRLTEAVWSSVLPQDQALLHSRAGWLMAAVWRDVASSDALFGAVSHLSAVQQLWTDPTELAQGHALFLQAARKAVASAAFELASGWFDVAFDLNVRRHGSDGAVWQADHDGQVDVHREAAEAAFAAGRAEVVHSLDEAVRAHGRDEASRVAVAPVRVAQFAVAGQNAEAVEVAFGALASLGERLPAPTTVPHVIVELLRARWALKGRGPDDLLQMAGCTDGRVLRAQEILASVGSAAYFLSPLTVTVVLLRGLSLAARFGPTRDTPFSFAGFGLVVGGILGRVEEGWTWGTGALRAIDALDAPELACRVGFLHNNFVAHWKQPLAETQVAYRAAWQGGLESGDIGFACGCMLFSATHGFIGGQRLDALAEDLAAFEAVFVRTGQTRTLPLLRMLRQAVRDLVDGPGAAGVLEGDFSATQTLAGAREEDRTTPFWVYLHRAVVRRLVGDRDGARDDLLAAEPLVRAAPGQALLGVFHLHRVLAAADALTTPGVDQARAWRKRLRVSARKLEGWAGHGPATYQHRALWAQAEAAVVQGLDATALYARALDRVRDVGLRGEHALMAQRAADWAAREGMRGLAATWRQAAVEAWAQWGATSRMTHLVQTHAALDAPGGRSLATTTTLATTSGSVLGATLDLEALLRASQAISEEIRLDGLLQRVATVLVQAAGASRLLLVRPAGEDFEVIARAEVAEDVVIDTAVVPLVAAQGAASGIVPYVARTGQLVHVDDVRLDDRWASLDASAGVGTRSVLCVPLRTRGALVGVVWLEHDRVVGAFTPDRIQTIVTLSSQASISFDNARLFERTEAIARAAERFVPKPFLELLGADTVTDVRLGDSALLDMSVLFMDLRGFTSMSEGMTPAEVFAFINEWLGVAEPVLVRHRGFVDKYIGDAIMGLFPGGAEHALQASIDLWHAKEAFNAARAEAGRPAIGIGIGLSHGPLVLGTVGGENRMDGTVISDVVNVAARVEGMTKAFGASVLLTGEVVDALRTPGRYDLRCLGRHAVRGRKEPVVLWEVVLGAPELVAARLGRQARLGEALGLREKGRGAASLAALEALRAEDPDDGAVQALCRLVHEEIQAGGRA